MCPASQATSSGSAGEAWRPSPLSPKPPGRYRERHINIHMSALHFCVSTPDCRSSATQICCKLHRTEGTICGQQAHLQWGEWIQPCLLGPQSGSHTWLLSAAAGHFNLGHSSWILALSPSCAPFPHLLSPMRMFTSVPWPHRCFCSSFASSQVSFSYLLWTSQMN